MVLLVEARVQSSKHAVSGSHPVSRIDPIRMEGGGEWQRPPASLEGQCDRLHGSLAGTPGPGVDQPPFPAIPFPAIGVPMGEPGEAPEGYPLQGYILPCLNSLSSAILL